MIPGMMLSKKLVKVGAKGSREPAKPQNRTLGNKNSFGERQHPLDLFKSLKTKHGQKNRLSERTANVGFKAHNKVGALRKYTALASGDQRTLTSLSYRGEVPLDKGSIKRGEG